MEHGGQYGFGLEAGSKPELLAVIALVDDGRPIICNGFKDAELHRDGVDGPEDRPSRDPRR